MILTIKTSWGRELEPIEAENFLDAVGILSWRQNLPKNGYVYMSSGSDSQTFTLDNGQIKNGKGSVVADYPCASASPEIPGYCVTGKLVFCFAVLTLIASLIIVIVQISSKSIDVVYISTALSLMLYSVAFFATSAALHYLKTISLK